MKEIDFLDAVGRVEPRFIEECIAYRAPEKRRVWGKRAGLLAACLTAVVFAVFFFMNHRSEPTITDENGFHIENGVLIRYTGSETDISIPESVRSIADFSFLENAGASNIRIVRLGSGVRNVESNAFAGLENLSEIVVDPGNASFTEKDGLLTTSDGTVLLRYMREGEKSFTIPDTVQVVAAHAVQNTDLEEIDFGENLECIGYWAFASCYRLNAVFLPDSVRTIGNGAFADCSSAVDGTFSRDAEIGEDAFRKVPFYYSMLAGQMCPGEEIVRGLVTPSEAILKSDLNSLSEQIAFVLAFLRGDGYSPGEEATFAYAAASSAPEVPGDMTVPEEFSIGDLSFSDNGWGGTGVYDLQILLPAGDYDIVMEAYGYDLFNRLYWKDARFRLTRVYYVKDAAAYDPGDTVKSGDWTAVFEKEGDSYKDITFIREDGTTVRFSSPYHSSEPYALTYSPGATRVVAEYMHVSGYPAFLVIVLNSDRIWNNGTYVDYMPRYFGAYSPGTVRWIDDDHLEGINEFGRFTLDIYQGIPVLLADEPQ